MYSTVNPFAIGVATKAAGIAMSEQMGWRFLALGIGTAMALAYVLRYAHKVRLDPSQSVCYDFKDKIEEKWGSQGEAPTFDTHMKLSLAAFGLAFVVLVYGIVRYLWWFDTMTAVFLACAIVLAFVSGLEEEVFMDQFISGAGDLMSVALVIGVARAVNMLLEDGLISDTILHFFSNLVSGMSPVIFIVMMLLVYIVLGFFINSSSGLAVLSIPIMAPLGDAVGVSKPAIIAAYNYGQGLISYITPQLVPLYFRKGSLEGKNYTVDEVWYTYPNGKSHVKQHYLNRHGEWSEHHHESDDCNYDMLSILSLARNWSVASTGKKTSLPTSSTLKGNIGERIHFPMATGKKVETQTLVYRGKKDWKANDGKTYHCLVFSLLDYEEKDKDKELLRFFVTDDQRHLPVRIDFYLKFGTAKAYLAKSN
jgi:hypothetical protein